MKLCESLEDRTMALALAEKNIQRKSLLFERRAEKVDIADKSMGRVHEAAKRVTGYDLEGKAKEKCGIIHLLNSGATCLDACGVYGPLHKK